MSTKSLIYFGFECNSILVGVFSNPMEENRKEFYWWTFDFLSGVHASWNINMTGCTIQKDRVSAEFGSTFGLRAGQPFSKMFEEGDKKSVSLQICCPSEMQNASGFFPLNFETVS